jgi:hypothetical protein
MLRILFCSKVCIKEKSVQIHEIIDHLSKHGTCIVLTNANLLSCETCNYFNLCGRATHCSAVATSCLARYCNDSYQVLHHFSTKSRSSCVILQIFFWD